MQKVKTKSEIFISIKRKWAPVKSGTIVGDGEDNYIRKTTWMIVGIWWVWIRMLGNL